MLKHGAMFGTDLTSVIDCALYSPVALEWHSRLLHMNVKMSFLFFFPHYVTLICRQKKKKSPVLGRPWVNTWAPSVSSFDSEMPRDSTDWFDGHERGIHSWVFIYWLSDWNVTWPASPTGLAFSCEGLIIYYALQHQPHLIQSKQTVNGHLTDWQTFNPYWLWKCLRMNHTCQNLTKKMQCWIGEMARSTQLSMPLRHGSTSCR